MQENVPRPASLVTIACMGRVVANLREAKSPLSASGPLSALRTASTPVTAFRGASVPEQLMLTSGLAYAMTFAALLTFGRPGLGVGQVFYLPIILVALANGPFVGAAGGVLGLVLFFLARLLAGDMGWHDLFTAPLEIRLVSFVVVGATVGYFASRARRMLSDSLVVLEDLLVLARRDLATGASTGRRFLSELERLVSQRASFAVLVGELQGDDRRSLLRNDRELRDVISAVATQLGPSGEVARIGSSQLAIAIPSRDGRGLHGAAGDLERALEDSGHSITFGWAVYPGEGDDALSLVQAANERLYARRAARGEWSPTPESSGLDNVVSINRGRSLA
jgi:GGDEF domain-containing protein